MTRQSWMSVLWERVRASWLRRPQRKLRLCETLALGERRSVAVVEFERVRYLLGCSAGAITLLGQLPAAPDRLAQSVSQNEPSCDR